MFSSRVLFSVSGLIACLIIQGCSQSSSGNGTPYRDPTYETSNDLKAELESAPLECQNSACNKAEFESIGLVGMLVEGRMTDSSFRIGQCTGFLYGAGDIVGLNSHCISDSMWNVKDDCKNYLGIKFPETPGHPSEVFMCEELLYRSDIGKDPNPFDIKADYSYFRIKPTSRKPLGLALQPSKPKDLISVRKVNPIDLKSQMGGYLDYAHCQLQNDSLLNIKYGNEWSETGLAVSSGNSCKIIHGNSGSPVLNSQNQVIGFAQSYFNDQLLDVLRSEAFSTSFSEGLKIKTIFNLPSSMPEHFQFTQAICTRSPKSLSAENTICLSRLAESKWKDDNSILSFENEKGIPDYAEKLKIMALGQYPTFMAYDFIKDSKSYTYSVTPRCLYNPTKWNMMAIDKDNSQLKSKIKTIQTVLKPVIYELTATFNLDKNLALKSRQLGHVVTNGRFVVNVDEIHSVINFQRSLINLQNPYYPTSDSTASPLNLTWCQ